MSAPPRWEVTLSYCPHAIVHGYILSHQIQVASCLLCCLLLLFHFVHVYFSRRGRTKDAHLGEITPPPYLCHLRDRPLTHLPKAVVTGLYLREWGRRLRDHL